MRLKGLTAQDIPACVPQKVIPSATLSLLGVPEIPFPPIFTRSTTPPTGIRLNPCATLLWGGPSGQLADPTLNAGHEPKFCIDVGSEHTPINLPARNISFQREFDATTAASEGLNLPRHSGHQAAASTRQQAQFSLETRFGIHWLQETGCGLRFCCKSDWHPGNWSRH